jgi:hypothetical protein
MTHSDPPIEDGYLHEAALLDHPPSNTKCAAGNDGALKSIGTHEHWNNNNDKKYSQNLGKREGIEMIRIARS